MMQCRVKNIHHYPTGVATTWLFGQQHKKRTEDMGLEKYAVYY